jgi:hypothetical protein
LDVVDGTRLKEPSEEDHQVAEAKGILLASTVRDMDEVAGTSEQILSNENEGSR